MIDDLGQVVEVGAGHLLQDVAEVPDLLLLASARRQLLLGQTELLQWTIFNNVSSGGTYNSIDCDLVQSAIPQASC